MYKQYLPRYSYQDYKNWKEDWELIDGYPWSLMPSRINHNQVQINAIFQSKLALLNNSGCNCKVFLDLDWKVNEETVVRPDIMIVCGETKTDFLEFPPVLIIEILSQATRVKDRTVKFDLYKEQGVKYYLLADYDQQEVEVYELIDNSYKEVQKTSFFLDDHCEISFEYDKWWI